MKILLVVWRSLAQRGFPSGEAGRVARRIPPSLRVALAVPVVVCLIMNTGQLVHARHSAHLEDDFKVYYTAASLVLHGESSLIYDGADTGIDPQQRWANPASVFAAEATRHGLSKNMLYVHPPVLADLSPLGDLTISQAEIAWTVFNIACLVAVSVMFGKLLKISSIPTFLGLSILPATGVNMIWGQVTILLMLLWAIGIVSYMEDKPFISSAALALATSNKMTPLIVVAPMLIRRDLKFLQGFVTTLACILGGVLWINTPGATVTYVQKVLPSMSWGHRYD
ncbi:MAG: glycosyltransferase family 87 protein [Acidobacteriaceae bacterium]